MTSIRQRLAALISALLLATSLAACEDGIGKTTTTSEAQRSQQWPRYSLDEAIRLADHIVIATVMGKDRPQPLPHEIPPFNRVVVSKLQIERVLKESDNVSRDSRFSELVEGVIDSEAETLKQLNPAPTYVEAGERYLLFLDEEHLPLSPLLVLHVDTRGIELPPALRPSNMSGDTLSEERAASIVSDSLRRQGILETRPTRPDVPERSHENLEDPERSGVDPDSSTSEGEGTEDEASDND